MSYSGYGKRALAIWTKLKGIVEEDETYIGGKEKNRHFQKRLNLEGVAGKTVIVALRERGGRTKATPVETSSYITLGKTVRDNVVAGSTIHTDENRAYYNLRKDYKHQAVNHFMYQYSYNGVTTNSVESVFAVLKRGLHGVYHHASKKHMGRYVNEFTWRLNDGNVARHTLERLDSFVSAVAGRRITYKTLTRPNAQETAQV